MASFLLIRLLRWTAGLLLILFVTYAMMFYGAGDPIRMMFIQGEDFDSEDEVVMLALRKKYGLDDPFLVQFGNYLNNLLHGDWGPLHTLASRPAGVGDRAIPLADIHAAGFRRHGHRRHRRYWPGACWRRFITIAGLTG